MAIGVTILIITSLIAAIWIIIEIKRLKHKLFAIFLIFLVLFGYFSFAFVLKNQDLDLKTVPGLIKAGEIYFSWLGSVLGNMKSLTSYAIKQDWGINESEVSRIHEEEINESKFLK